MILPVKIRNPAVFGRIADSFSTDFRATLSTNDF